MDSITGTAGNDTINAVIDGTTNAVTSTLTALDVINGGAGTDSLTLNILNGVGGAGTAVNALPSVTISNVETMNVRAAVDFGVAGVNDSADGNAGNSNGTASTTVDFSNYTGLTTLNLTQAAQASIKAAATTDINVSGATGAVEVVSGKNVVVTDSTVDKNITVGSSVAAAADNANTAGAVAGTITVTDSKQGAGVILVDGGTTVNVTASSDKTSGAIVVGAVKAATGAVTVTQNTTSDNTAAITAGDINVTGGSTVTVNVNSTNTATKDSTGVNDITAGSITVTGDSKTTAVTVTQTHVANDYASVTTGASKETSAVTFASLKSGEKIAISAGASSGLGTDLTFTASKDLTAAEVASVFANLTAADIQTSGGKVANGIFTGALDAGWTTGAASGSTVTFTATADGNQANEITLTVKKADGTTNVDNLASFTIVKVDGSAGTTTTARDLTTANGNVTVNDNATAAITDLTINGYGTATIGTTTALTKLANLSLANSGNTATVDAATGITSLNLTVNNVKHAVDISTNSTTVATLNVTASGADSSFALTAAQVKDLTVSGDKSLTLTGTTTALENVTVTGSASLDISGVSANAAKSITTTGTTGTVKASIDGTAATYAGGAGVDTVTLVTGTALTKSINLGAGDDTLVFSSAVSGSSATLSGGDGTDTLSMDTSRADALDATAQTFYTNFERLTLNNANTAALTVDLANLGFTNYVTTSGTGSVTYVGGVAALANGETFSFVYNGTTYTTGAVTVAGATVTAAELDTAIDATAVGAGKITASLTNGGADITLTVDSANDTLTAGVLDAAGNNITGTDQALTLNKLAANATVVLTKDGAVTATLADATGSSDVVNVVANVAAANIDFGTFTAANVETINITANDTKADDNGDGTTTTAESAPEKATLTLTADKATTVNLTGSAAVDLTLTGSTKVTLIDGSAMTGALSVTSLNTTAATTIKGGSAADTLTAATGSTADIIYGNDGNDSLTANAGMSKLYGGNGADTFNITVASTNVNSAATIMDAGTGDVIKFGGAAGNDFKSAAISLDSTAVFQDYANAAIAAITVTDDLAWFQYGGNTYIVQEKNAGTNADVFVNNEDFIVKIAGTVDLSTASWNKTSGTLEIA